MVRAVVTGIADTVTVSVRLIQISVFVFYIRIVSVFAFYVRAVIEIIGNLIVVFIGNARITGHRILISVRMQRAVVACVADSVVVSIFLISIRFFWAVVEVIFYVVAVNIDRFGSTCKRTLVSVGVIGAAVASVSDAVTVSV